MTCVFRCVDIAVKNTDLYFDEHVWSVVLLLDFPAHDIDFCVMYLTLGVVFDFCCCDVHDV